MAEIELALATPATVRQALGLSQERMSRLLGCGPKTLARWERFESDPGPHAWQVLAVLKQVVELACRVYSPDGVFTYLDAPKPSFGGRTAFQLIADGDSARVLAALAADHEGLGY